MARRTSIPKPLALVIGLLLVIGGGGLLTASAINGNEAFSALQRGDPLYTERSLSQNTVTLAVHVRGLAEGERPQPVEGVTVTLYKWTRDGAEPETRAQTGERGTATFELRPDRYYVSAAYDGSAARHAMSLQSDTRLSVLIDEQGNIHFQSGSREDMRERGQMNALFVRVAQMNEDRQGRAPVEGAKIIVYTYLGEDERGEPIARNETDARGGAGFYLHTARYIVHVETPDGHEAWFRVGLHQDTSAVVMFNPDGSARTNVYGNEDTTTETRPDERPSRERPTTQDSTRPSTATTQETRPLAFWLRWISS